MDTTQTYRDIIKHILLKYAQKPPSHGDIRLDPIFDEKNDRYALMQVGWDRGRRVRGNLIYVTISNGKVQVEYDGIESGIFDNLIENGIPKEKIELTYLPSEEPAPVV